MDAQRRLNEGTARHAPTVALGVATAWLLAAGNGAVEARVWGPVALVLTAWALAALARGRGPKLRTPAAVAALSLGALSAWAACSIAWSDYVPHLAWEEAGRTGLYAAGVAVAVTTVVTAQAFVKATTWIALALTGMGVWIGWRLLSEDPIGLFAGGRLQEPFTYANGVAAAAGVGAWLCVGLSLGAEARAGAGLRTQRLAAAITSAFWLAGAALLTHIVILTQSRSAAIAALAAGTALMVVSPRRMQLAARLAVVGAVAVAATPRLGRVFSKLGELADAPYTKGADVKASREAAITAIHEAGGSLVIGTASTFFLATALTLVTLAVLDRRQGMSLAASTGRRASRMAIVGFIAVSVGVVALSAGDSPRWVKRQWEACRSPGSYNEPVPQRRGSHLEDLGTNRCDFWRVAADNWRGHPLKGVGAQQFGGWYALDRRSPELPQQAHSLPLQLLGELGLVGALLGLTLLGSIAAAAVTYARSGPTRDPTFAGAVAATTAWLTHASLDWTWTMTAVTLPVLVLAGGLLGCTSTMRTLIDVRTRSRLRTGAGLATGGALGLALLAPLTAADAFAWRATRPGEDVGQRRSDARRAETLAPLWAAPLILRGRLELKEGHTRKAAAVAREALDREPGNWRTQLAAAKLLQGADLKASKAARQAAKRLNPRRA